MSNQRYRPVSGPLQAIKKLFLSLFVIGAFGLYVLVERLTRPDSALTTGSILPTATAISAPTSPLVPFATAPAGLSSQGPTTAPTANASVYKSGTYQGQPVDAYYGLVQVQVNIQGGAIKSVDVLQYPSDRRTSQQINSIAVPYLQQEAVQAQSANIDIVSGATLTSEGFAMSLQSALQAAHR
jgi:uncharacterized protein with FMN-binding domain